MNAELEKYLNYDYRGVVRHPRCYRMKRAKQFHPFNPLKMFDNIPDIESEVEKEVEGKIKKNPIDGFSEFSDCNDGDFYDGVD